jgi:hypothetical protein
MKRKSLFSLLTIVLLVGVNALYAKTIVLKGKTKTVTNNTDDIDKYLSFETPSQIGIRSIKDYFSQSHIKAFNNHKDIVSQDSKTKLFNQSFVQYIKKDYNKRNYANIISQDGTHIVDFLELGNELNLDAATTYVFLRLIYNKTKACELVDDTVILQILSRSPELLCRFFDQDNCSRKKQNTKYIKQHVEDVLLTKFTDHLDSFYRSPDAFLSTISKDIAKKFKQEIAAINKKHEEKSVQAETIERLRQTIIKFFELATSKAIWNIQEPEGIWNSFLSLANGFQQLGANMIVNHMDDLDDLLWSLVHRFCYFLDLAGTSLPVAFFEEIEQDLEQKVVFFLETKEQDDGIKSKKETLLEGLVQGKAKALAYQQGIMTEGW